MAALVLLAAQPNAQGPSIVVETSSGSVTIEMFAEDAPKTVAHIVELVKSGFYDGQRIHRVVPGFVVQWGDPRSRDASQEAEWGRGAAAGSGSPIGAAEITKKRTHVRGAVGVAHPGNPTLADSQIYVTLSNHDELNGLYTIFGRVASGTEVLDSIQRGDVIRRIYLRP